MYTLVITSATFLYPAYYAIVKNKSNTLARLSTINSILSIIFWLDPNNKYKYIVDIIVANVSGITYFIYGVKYIPPDNKAVRIIGYINGGLMILLFNGSCISYNNNATGNMWVIYDTCFHLCTLVGKLLVLTNIQF